MDVQHTNRLATRGLVALSLVALATVTIGFTRPPLPDEGALAHIFQLTILALVPTGLVFLATADWTEPLQTAKQLRVPAAAVVAAFAALYYLEHYFYPTYYR